ncbi:hypothetical protein GCM10009665_65890 [Kitasatospora nipponensis]|uniref:Resolvase-like protein n=1 Tax=Kitasatospora nipponensis TaxID=258049 RepID=A0ABN1WVF8_9ACTN
MEHLPIRAVCWKRRSTRRGTETRLVAEMFVLDRSDDAGPASRTAIYLRCYPLDVTAMECHRRALEDLARDRGLSQPVVFLDNGLRAGDELPARDALLRAVSAGLVDTLLVPGPYVFGLDDEAAGAVVDELARHGCRLVQLPSRRARARERRAREPGRLGELTPAA